MYAVYPIRLCNNVVVAKNKTENERYLNVTAVVMWLLTTRDLISWPEWFPGVLSIKILSLCVRKQNV